MNVRACCLAVLAGLTVAAAGAAAPQRLLVQVRDTPPDATAAIRHGADGSYSVSTGGGDVDERADAAGNGTTLSTSSSVRRVHVRAGERVRVDLPGVQSLQFHVPLGAAGGAQPPAGGNAGVPPGPSGAGAAAYPPSVSGVVTFEAVTAFAARFALVGSSVRIELAPLHVDSVVAPYAVAGNGTERVVTLRGRVGQWIALGDTELSPPATRLDDGPEPVRPASVWVRVDPDPAGDEP